MGRRGKTHAATWSTFTITQITGARLYRPLFTVPASRLSRGETRDKFSIYVPRNDSNQSPTHLAGFSQLWTKRDRLRDRGTRSRPRAIRIDLKVSIKRIPSRRGLGHNARAPGVSPRWITYSIMVHMRRERVPLVYMSELCRRRKVERRSRRAPLYSGGAIPSQPTNYFTSW